MPGKHTALSDALVPRIHPFSIWIGEAVGATGAILPGITNVCDLVPLRIIYNNFLRIQVRERKKENKRRCEREARRSKCTKGTKSFRRTVIYTSQHSGRWYRQASASRRVGDWDFLGLRLGLSRGLSPTQGRAPEKPKKARPTIGS